MFSIRPEETDWLAWDGVLEGVGVGGAVGLDDGLGDAHQSGAAHLAGIHQLLEPLEPAGDHHRRQLGQQVLLEYLLDLPGQEETGALHGLEEDISGVAVGHDDVHAALHGLYFLCEFFQLAKEQHIHTTLDTAGQPFTTAEPFFSRLTTLLEHTDLVILDLKHIDPEKHRLLTGHSNESILSFARFLDQIHKPMWVRHVLVPGITDALANLHGIRAFLDTLSNVEKVEILPYHTLGIYKWETLGIPYSLSDIRIPDENDLKRANQILLG